ncbi:helix-turn-helix domain-containing protein [Shewanella abyssi]|uniref:helix-turn-helix domain-containing protein n=1 Tax=Shewanella abyssi TaxID=311789 RepID=UPI00200CC979|nr:helix-turn-helix domain-containing protein [Shewanella abyssi]MCL1049545.1 helix-turn-helix domain-containing protein [Shewanella abyssi]
MTTKNNGRATLSSKRENITSNSKDELILDTCHALMAKEITTGQALKKLRVSLLSINQDEYAKMVGLTRKVISEIERDKSKSNVDVLNQSLRGVGLNIAILPRDKFLQEQVLKSDINE